MKKNEIKLKIYLKKIERKNANQTKKQREEKSIRPKMYGYRD